jgi:hypothetical protein
LEKNFGPSSKAQPYLKHIYSSGFNFKGKELVWKEPLKKLFRRVIMKKKKLKILL